MSSYGHVTMRKMGHKLKARTEAETIEELSLLACFLRLARLPTFLTQPTPSCLADGTAHSGLDPPT